MNVGSITHKYCWKTTICHGNPTVAQAWWEDIKGPNGGHADKANSPGWPALNSKSNLVFALATIAWSASAHHAAVNFDQYDYSGK